MFNVYRATDSINLIQTLKDVFDDKVARNPEIDPNTLTVNFVVAYRSNSNATNETVTSFEAYLFEGVFGAFNSDGDDVGNLEELVERYSDCIDVEFFVFERQ